MVSFASFRGNAALLAVLVVAAATIPGAHAYVPSDVCSMEVTLTYYIDGVSGTQIVFPIGGAGNTQDESINIDGETTAELQLQPGDVTIQVQGILCTADPDNGATIAWDTGESAETNIDGTNTPSTLLLIALDQQAQQSVDFSLDYNPIITSVSVTPNVGTYDAATLFSFTAIDPASGASIEDYTLTYTGLQASQFQSTAANSGDTIPDFARCQDATANNNQLGSCAIQYQPALPDAGNFPWTMTVTDNTGQTDAVGGFFAVDDTGTLDLTIENWHVPKIDSVTPTDSDGAPTSKIQFGKTGSMTISITDPDITNGLDDIPILTLLEVVTLDDTISELSQTNVACPGIADVTITVESTVGDTITYVAVWEPWTAAVAGGSTASDYGETWCAFKFESSDTAVNSAGVPAPLYSNEVEYTMAAIGTPTTGGEATSQIPHFSMLFISDTTPMELDVVTVSVTWQDGDSLSSFAVTHAGVLQDVAWSEEESSSDSENSIDSTAGAVTRTLLMTIAANAAAEADQSVTLTLTDQDDANLVDTRTITFATVSDDVARNRRSIAAGVAAASGGAGGAGAGGLAIRKRRTIVQRQQIPTSSMQISLDGTNMKIKTSAIQGSVDSDANTNGNDDHTSGGGASRVAPNLVGALVGCAILAVVLVGVVTRTKQSQAVTTAATRSLIRTLSTLSGGSNASVAIADDAVKLEEGGGDNSAGFAGKQLGITSTVAQGFVTQI